MEIMQELLQLQLEFLQSDTKQHISVLSGQIPQLLLLSSDDVDEISTWGSGLEGHKLCGVIHHSHKFVQTMEHHQVCFNHALNEVPVWYRISTWHHEDTWVPPRNSIITNTRLLRESSWSEFGLTHKKDNLDDTTMEAYSIRRG
jgi:hypothetical protein